MARSWLDRKLDFQPVLDRRKFRSYGRAESWFVICEAPAGNSADLDNCGGLELFLAGLGARRGRQ